MLATAMQRFWLSAMTAHAGRRAGGTPCSCSSWNTFLCPRPCGRAMLSCLLAHRRQPESVRTASFSGCHVKPACAAMVFRLPICGCCHARLLNRRLGSGNRIWRCNSALPCGSCHVALWAAWSSTRAKSARLRLPGVPRLCAWAKRCSIWRRRSGLSCCHAGRENWRAGVWMRCQSSAIISFNSACSSCSVAMVVWIWAAACGSLKTSCGSIWWRSQLRSRPGSWLLLSFTWARPCAAA